MDMLLMGACLALLGLAVSCLAFGAATRGADAPEPAVQLEEELPARAPAHFFANPVVIPAPPQPPVPLEALLLQIENHVRLEQAVAESFLQSPTPALLHSRTASPLVN